MFALRFQYTGRLHGGISALVMESVASSAAVLASPPGSQVLGLDVSCSHLVGAMPGDLVVFLALPLRVGRTVHVSSPDNGPCTARVSVDRGYVVVYHDTKVVTQ